MRNFIKRKCEISKCKTYRWALELFISNESAEIIFIGLNPSMSNNSFTDNTTKKIIRICENLHYGKVKIINLFALIAKSPSFLKFHKDPIGEINNKIINQSLEYWSMNNYCHLWLGWGNQGDLHNRSFIVRELINDYYLKKRQNFNNPISPLLIRKTKNNHPIHPLYCKNNSKLTSYL